MTKYIILFLFFFNSILYAEVVKKIDITGNKRVSKETIIVYGEISIEKDYSNIELDEVLKNLYSTQFFEDIKIDKTSSFSLYSSSNLECLVASEEHDKDENNMHNDKRQRL